MRRPPPGITRPRMKTFRRRLSSSDVWERGTPSAKLGTVWSASERRSEETAHCASSFGFYQLPEHVVQDPSVPVVAELLGCVDSGDGLEGFRRGTRRTGPHGEHGAWAHGLVEPLEVERLEAREPERLARFALRELERNHAHPHQVRAMNPLERLGDHRANA